MSWRSRPLGPDVLAELKRKAERVPGKRHQVLALFSRAGFTEPLQAEAASQGVLDEEALLPYLWEYCSELEPAGDALILDISYPDEVDRGKEGAAL